jgi:hypothetical protein
MAPIAGMFLATVGATLIVGGFLPRFRERSIWIGFALGAVSVALFGGALLLPPPSAFQLGALVLAVGVEVAAFAALLPTLHRAGERAVVPGTLAIVGGHFLLMLPAFGPAIGALGALCLANALILWRSSRYPLSSGWAVEGVIKLALGVVMLASFPGFA